MRQANISLSLLSCIILSIQCSLQCPGPVIILSSPRRILHYTDLVTLIIPTNTQFITEQNGPSSSVPRSHHIRPTAQLNWKSDPTIFYINSFFCVQFFCSKNVMALAVGIEILLPSLLCSLAWPGLISLPHINTDL